MTKRKPLALITGAGSGIGRALAFEAAAAGCDLVLVGRRQEPLTETVRLIGNPATRIVIADIASPEGRARVVAEAGERLDYLVNNAGKLCVGRLTELGDDDIAGMISTNVTGTILLTRDMVPALAATQGRVVNIGSMFGLIAFPYFAAYSATKFATRGLSDALRRELSEYGISVTYAAPRATQTPAQSHFAHLVEPFGMAMDTPDRIARRTWAGVMAGRNTIYPGAAERFFSLVQAVVPSLVDNALIGKVLAPRTQAALVNLTEQREA